MAEDDTGASDPEAAPLLEHLFSAFDVKNTGVVDFVELATGLSVLCRGSADDKVGLLLLSLRRFISLLT